MLFRSLQEGRAPLGTRAINLKIATMYPSQFLEVYGRPNRLTLPERKVTANLPQTLHMLAGVTYTEKISREGGRLDRLLKSGAADREIIEELYMAAFSRFPAAEEVQAAEQTMKSRPRREAFEDLLWALLSSREFAYRH